MPSGAGPAEATRAVENQGRARLKRPPTARPSTLRLLSSSKHDHTSPQLFPSHSLLLRREPLGGACLATALNQHTPTAGVFTAQPEALLLLAAGPADYLLLQLYSGRLQVSDVALLDSFSSFQCTPPPASCDLGVSLLLPPRRPALRWTVV